MFEQLKVQVRSDFGTQRCTRLRRAGLVPAVLYGQKKPNVHLAVPAHELEAIVRHGGRMVRLTGDIEEEALIKEVQWDTWGVHILHVDFTRVSAKDRVRVTVPLHLRGEAPGSREGGVVEHLLHTLELECEAGEVPEEIHVVINELHVGGAITVGQLPLPKSAVPLVDKDTVVARCVVPAEVPEAEEAVAAPAEKEPELIRRREKEEEEEE
ncbi:MAG: 50S ribosomal protein L25 [Thermoguttaceae bacterium]|nr:50S ribosomal protein L25 [Thermoguttaceae bacterium]MDW8078784.1 50S ribosomal protein L25 [Thermoguttaceae bacterium]